MGRLLKRNGDRKHLRRPDSRWCVYYRVNEHGPFRPEFPVRCPAARGWFRWRWQARRHRRYIKRLERWSMTPSTWFVVSAEEYDAAWAEYDAQFDWNFYKEA